VIVKGEPAAFASAQQRLLDCVDELSIAKLRESDIGSELPSALTGQAGRALSGKMGKLVDQISPAVRNIQDLYTALSAYQVQLAGFQEQERALRAQSATIGPSGVSIEDDGELYPPLPALLDRVAQSYPTAGLSDINCQRAQQEVARRQDQVATAYRQLDFAAQQLVYDYEQAAQALASKLAMPTALLAPQLSVRAFADLRFAAMALNVLEGQILGPLQTMTPAQIEAWFNALPPGEAARLAAMYPHELGNLNGVPLSVRGQANWLLLNQAIAEASAHGGGTQLALLEGIRARMVDEAGAPVATLIMFDPDQDHYGVLWGDPDAANIGVFVPGVGEDNNIPSWITDAQNMYDAAGRGDSAVIMWKGYADPKGPTLPGVVGPTPAIDPDVLNAASASRAVAGAKDLTAFCQDGLGLNSGQSLTLIGHSYGSLVVGVALADDGLAPNRVVVAGSPGMGVNDIKGLHLSSDQFYAERAPGDPVANNLGGFGADPADPGFGGHRLATNAAGDPSVSGHSDYFNSRTQSVVGIGHVISGTVQPGDIQHPNAGDQAGALARTASRDTLGPGSVSSAIAGNVGTGVRDTVDAGVAGVKNAISTAKEGWDVITGIF